MSVELNILKEAGLDTETGLSYTGGLDKYISAANRFYKNYEKNRTKVEEYLSAKDYENYMITVHALKSNSKMIGALELSAGFEALEGAARDNDTAYIEAHNAEVISMYEKLMDGLKPIGLRDSAQAAGEISGNEAKQVSDSLLAALDDFDDEKSKELANKLSGYPFRITQRDRLKEAIAFIDDFMYDEAAEIIREIYTAIE